MKLILPELSFVVLIGVSGSGKRTFARHEPLRRVHESVAGVLALESEPVDPRL
jgi:ABC-type proline/glycine betaine transport system ATPase subunit